MVKILHLAVGNIQFQKETDMTDVYIVADYGKLYRRNDTFRFLYPDGSESIFFPHNTQRILISGKIEITPDALRMMMHHNIEAVFIGRNGKFDGRLVFQEGKNVFIRQQQYRRLDDEKFKVSFCKNIVTGKIKNQLSFAMRIRRERGLKSKEVFDAIDSISDTLKKIETSSSVDQVRGLEGAAARSYFSVYRYNIKPEWAVFKGRKMNPPGDNVNAVMSFIYTLMSYSVESAIIAEGLDPYVGYLHSLEYGRKSLIFDLMEEYRVPVCDTLSASMFNLGILKEDEFESVDFSKNSSDHPLGEQESEEEGEDNSPVPGRKGVLLTDSGVKKAIVQYENKLAGKYFYNPTGEAITFKKIIASQVKHFKRILKGEESVYRPFVIK